MHKILENVSSFGLEHKLTLPLNKLNKLTQTLN